MSEGANIKLLDELLVLFDLYEEDYNVVEQSLTAIAQYRLANPEHPVTASLYHYLKKHGYC